MSHSRVPPLPKAMNHARVGAMLEREGAEMGQVHGYLYEIRSPDPAAGAVRLRPDEGLGCPRRTALG